MQPGASTSDGVVSPPKRLNYGTAKTVLHYMNTFTRIFLHIKHPNQFETRFQTIPYRISCLKFEENMILIDQKIFSLENHATNMQRLAKVLGGGNRCHYVDCLSVSNLNSIKNLPKDLKMTVRKMVLQDDATPVFILLRKIHVIIENPIEKILIHVHGPRDPIFANTITANDTKVLALVLKTPPGVEGQWALPLINLSHPSIELNESEVSDSDFLRIVIDWMKNPRPIGHQIGFVTNDVPKYFKIVLERRNKLRIFEKNFPFCPTCVALPAGPDREIVIHVTKSPYYEQEFYLPNRILGMLVMEVVEKNSDEKFNIYY